MASEDARYKQSSQFRLWSFSPAGLQELREKTNSLAKLQIAPRVDAANIDFLASGEETQLVKLFTVELIRAAHFCDLPTEIRSTAAMFFRRFYITNSVMTYPPTELLKTSLFFGCKAEGFYIRLAKLAEKFPNTTSEQILAGEFLLCQSIRFAFDVRHPFRALEGAILQLRLKLKDEEVRIDNAHAKARDILKFSALVTDVYFHYTPSQIMMAALLIVDEGLVDVLFPKQAQRRQDGDQNGNHHRPTDDEYASQYEKIMKTVRSCKTMLEEEPPERMTEYWGTVCSCRDYGLSYDWGKKLTRVTTKPEVVKSMKPLRKKLQKCRDPDRASLVELQRARREQVVTNAKTADAANDGTASGNADARGAKRRKVEQAEDPFGPALR